MNLFENLQKLNEDVNNPVIKIIDNISMSEVSEYLVDLKKYDINATYTGVGSAPKSFNYCLIGKYNDILDFFINECHESKDEMIEWLNNEGEILENENTKLQENNELIIDSSQFDGEYNELYYKYLNSDIRLDLKSGRINKGLFITAYGKSTMSVDEASEWINILNSAIKDVEEFNKKYPIGATFDWAIEKDKDE